MNDNQSRAFAESVKEKLQATDVTVVTIPVYRSIKFTIEDEGRAISYKTEGRKFFNMPGFAGTDALDINNQVSQETVEPQQTQEKNTEEDTEAEMKKQEKAAYLIIEKFYKPIPKPYYAYQLAVGYNGKIQVVAKKEKQLQTNEIFMTLSF